MWDQIVRAMGRHDDLHAVRVPGRVNLIGDHTDYCDGFVFPMAIDRECVVAWAPRSGRNPIVCARSLQLEGQVVVRADGADEPERLEPGWGRFVAGAVAAITAHGGRVPALDMVVSSSVPVGAGLSSSSALSVGLVLALTEAAELEVDRRDLARLALDAEVRATAVPGGLMDQLSALFGVADHALLIDCRTLAVVAVPWPHALGVVVVHSGLQRQLAGSAYAARREACQTAAARLGVPALRDASPRQVADDPIARHVVSENRRVLEFAAALRAGDVTALGALMLASHGSLRDDYQVSTPELDLLVTLLVEAGAFGARLTGAGFGGCVVALTQRSRAEEVGAKAVLRAQRAGIDAHAFVVRPSSAAAVLEPPSGATGRARLH